MAAVRDFFTARKRKVPPHNDQFPQHTKQIKNSAVQEDSPTDPISKPILVVLPGASGALAKDVLELLIPALKRHFEVRVRPTAKWKGWDVHKNAQAVVKELCPIEADAAPWYVLGASFGNRVATAIVGDGLTAVLPSLVLTGYPLYGPKGSSERVQQIQSLPASARVLCISGTKDEFLGKNAPDGPKGEALLREVVEGMACSATTEVQMIINGGHGVFPSAKGQKNDALDKIMRSIKAFVEKNKYAGQS